MPISTWLKPGRASPYWVLCVFPALGAPCQALPTRLLCNKPRFFCKVEKFPLPLHEESLPAHQCCLLQGEEGSCQVSGMGLTLRCSKALMSQKGRGMLLDTSRKHLRQRNEGEGSQGGSVWSIKCDSIPCPTEARVVLSHL